jgi:hypothetical protein
MNMRLSAVLVVIALVSLGLAVRAQLQLRQARAIVQEDLSGIGPSDAAPVAVAAPLPGASDAQLRELRQQVAALQAERGRLQSELADAQLSLADRARITAAPVLPPPGSNTARRASFEDRMAQLQRDDPARYEEMQKQREEFIRRVQTQADERSEFLKKIDTAGMTGEQRVNHDKLLQAVEQARALMAQVATLPPEEAAAARRQMQEAVGTVSELYQQERRYLLEQTGRAMGYPGMEAAQFADYIQQIYNQTALPHGLGGRSGRSGRERTAGAPAATGAPGVGASAP